jgi:hypothetical protein
MNMKRQSPTHAASFARWNECARRAGTMRAFHSVTTHISTSGIATVTRVLKSKSLDGTIRRSVELNMGSENDPKTAKIGTELLRKTAGGDRAWLLGS